MANYNNYIFFDMETGNRLPCTTQPTQLAAVAIDGRSLQPYENTFNSEIKPVLDDEKAKNKGLDPVEDDALKVTGKTRDELAKAPSPKVVWKQFVEWVNQFNPSGGQDRWKAPIRCGYNIHNFDDVITNRLCKEYGPYDKTYQRDALFHPIHSVDLMEHFFVITESMPEVTSLSFDNLRTWLGLSHESSHDALTDVKQGALVLVRYITLIRNRMKGVKFQDSLSNVKLL